MKTLAIGLMLLGMLCLSASVGRADDLRCVGELDDVMVGGNLRVPYGASCILRGVTVRGDILVWRNAALHLSDGTVILGDVKADHCDFVAFEPSGPTSRIVVGGSVEIAYCGETSGKLFSAGRVAVGGDFLCHDNNAPCFAVSLTIGSDMLINRNSGGVSYIEGNAIGGDLECLGNIGVTDYGSPNRVAGERRWQCARLS